MDRGRRDDGARASTLVESLLKTSSMKLGVSIAVLLFSGVALADPKPLEHVDATPKSVSQNALTTAAATASVKDDYNGALELASKAIKNNPDEPWGHYDRGQALIALGRTADGVAELRAAEQRFPADDVWGRSLAVWGRARAHDLAGQCKEARAAFAEYEALLSSVDTHAAKLSSRIASECKDAPAAPAIAKSPISVFSTKAPRAASSAFGDAVTAFGGELSGAYGAKAPFRIEIALTHLAMAIELAESGAKHRDAADRIRRAVALAPKTVAGQGQLVKDAVATAARALGDISTQAYAGDDLLAGKSRDLAATAAKLVATPDERTSRVDVIVSLARADQTLRAMTTQSTRVK